MNSLWSRSFKSIYRREPLLSFAATAGAVNVAIGGFSAHWVLMLLGSGTVGIAISLRLWQLHTRNPTAFAFVKRRSVYALPPSASRPTLPLLSIPKKNPPNY